MILKMHGEDWHLSCLDFPWTCSINSFTIGFEPRSHLPQAFFKHWDDCSLGGGSNINKDVSSKTNVDCNLNMK